jgi:ABC-type transport system involved in multi-copper enzyme maturation permease subunit
MITLITAEWTKIRSLRSTIWTVTLTIALSAGLAYLIGFSFRSRFADLTQDQRDRFDPLFATFYSLTLGQLALVALAVLLVTGEYSSGTIRASLAATPRRNRFYTAKVLAGALLSLSVAVITVLVTFAAAQAGLGPHGTSLGANGALTAAFGACVYLTLIYLLATGLAALLRNAIPTLGILLPLLFLGSQGLGNVPTLKTFTQYLPDQAGAVIMHLSGPAADPRFARPYGPWTGLAIMGLWTATALLAGYLSLRHRDV